MTKKPTVCGVQVHTWGTSYGGDSGAWLPIKRTLYGENRGHASITLTIPANDNSFKLINKYCTESFIDDDGQELVKTIIPHSINRITHATGITEDVYKFFFSPWDLPSLKAGIYLSENINFDRNCFWFGTNFEWSDNAKETFSIEYRIYRSILGSGKQALGPFTIEHLNESIKDNLSFKDAVITYRSVQRIRGLESLMSKLNNAIKSGASLKLSELNKLLINNLFNDIDPNLLNAKKLSIEECEKIIEKVREDITITTELIENGDESLSPEEVDKYLTIGSLENSVSLPIDYSISNDIGFKSGINVEAMLQDMHTKSKGTSGLNDYRNCSNVISEVLEAGSRDHKYLKDIFSKRAFLGVNTPQFLYNSVLQAQDVIINDRKETIWDNFKDFNPAYPIERAIYRLIAFSYEHYIAIPFSIAALTLLILPLVITKALSWPVNKIGAIMIEKSNEKNVKSGLSKESSDSIGSYNVGDNSLKDDEYLKELSTKVKEIRVLDPIIAITEFASVLKRIDLIPVFSNQDFLKLKKYIDKNGESPESLIKSIKKLDLPLPKDFDYKKLDSLLDALQLLAAQRVCDNTKVLHDLIKNRKITLQNTSVSDNKNNDNANNARDSSPSLKPKKPEM